MTRPATRYLFLCKEALAEPGYENALLLPLPPHPSLDLLARTRGLVLAYMDMMFCDALSHEEAISEIRFAADRLIQITFARLKLSQATRREQP